MYLYHDAFGSPTKIHYTHKHTHTHTNAFKQTTIQLDIEYAAVGSYHNHSNYPARTPKPMTWAVSIRFVPKNAHTLNNFKLNRRKNVPNIIVRVRCILYGEIRMPFLMQENSFEKSQNLMKCFYCRKIEIISTLWYEWKKLWFSNWICYLRMVGMFISAMFLRWTEFVDFCYEYIVW